MNQSMDSSALEVGTFFEDFERDKNNREKLNLGQGKNCGYMYKAGKHNKDFKLRFFVLENLNDIAKATKLAYYTDETLRHRKGNIELKEVTGLENRHMPEGEIDEETGRGWVFVLHTSSRQWLIKATSPEIRDRWTVQLAAICGLQHAPLGPTTEQVERKMASKYWRQAAAAGQPLYVEAEVAGWEQRKEKFKEGVYIAYQVRVRTNASFAFEGRTDFSVWHRYSDFMSLNRSLLTYPQDRELDVERRPYLPARNHRGRFSGAVLEHRRQCFTAFLAYWIKNTVVLPLPIYAFLEHSERQDQVSETLQSLHVESMTSGDQVKACVPPKLPPLLRFTSEASYSSRLEALRTWVETRSQEELARLLTCAFAAKLVESVGGLSPSHRVQVAEMLINKVADPQRLFLVLEHIPHSRLPELVDSINCQYAAH